MTYADVYCSLGPTRTWLLSGDRIFFFFRGSFVSENKQIFEGTRALPASLIYYLIVSERMAGVKEGIAFCDEIQRRGLTGIIMRGVLVCQNLLSNPVEIQAQRFFFVHRGGEKRCKLA